jgi:integrase
MARQATGQFYCWKTKRGTRSFGVRFRYGGKRRLVTLGSEPEMTRREAETAMADLMADVRRGLWVPPEERRLEPREVPSFHEFASEWFAGVLKEGGRDGRGLSERSVRDLRDWRLREHVLPFFARYRLDEIDVEVVDGYRRAKVREGRLSPASINKMLTTVAAILEVAVEYGYLDRNPAKGRRRRLKAGRPRRTALDRPEQIAALLDAAGELDRRSRTGEYRRALLAALVFGGFRIGELLDLRWKDVYLGDEGGGNVVALPVRGRRAAPRAGTIRVRGTKTANADRTVRLLPVLRDELAALKARRSPAPDDRVFATSRGGRFAESNVRRRILAPAVERANAALADAEVEPIPDGLTPHSLRRTFASILVALREDPATVMRQMGHATAGFTLSVYARAMESSDEERERLRALVEGSIGQELGNRATDEPADEEGREAV